MVLIVRLVLASCLALMAIDLPAQGTSALYGRVNVQLAPPPARPDIAGLGAALPRAVESRPSVVYLETAPRSAFEAPTERRARMDQRGETFVPHVLAITAGTRVDFPNSDPVFHNVFSLSRLRPFDLGRYAAGRSKSVVFNRPGIIRVFCDIHAHMNAWILVFAHRYFAVTDAAGRYRIDGIPAGSYTVNIWNEAVPTEARNVTLAAGTPVELNATLGPERGAP